MIGTSVKKQLIATFEETEGFMLKPLEKVRSLGFVKVLSQYYRCTVLWSTVNLWVKYSDNILRRMLK